MMSKVVKFPTRLNLHKQAVVDEVQKVLWHPDEAVQTLWLKLLNDFLDENFQFSIYPFKLHQSTSMTDEDFETLSAELNEFLQKYQAGVSAEFYKIVGQTAGLLMNLAEYQVKDGK